MYSSYGNRGAGLEEGFGGILIVVTGYRNKNLRN